MIDSFPGPDRPIAALVVLGASEVVTAPPELGPLRPGPDSVGAIERGAVAVADGRVLWTGPEEQLTDAVEIVPETRTLRADGCLVCPGLVDPHTHLVHGGERADEFHLRNSGASYAELAAAGAGILSTVRATRAASEEELLRSGAARLQHVLSQGVTCCEVKSGYGLSLDTELRILRVARRLGELQPVRIVPTFLGAHSVPPEHKAHRAEYLRLLVDEMIPAVAEQGLAEACDVFCEDGVFDLAESERVLRAAQDAGLKIHVHAEQFVPFGGAALAARVGALSADHLEAVTQEAAVLLGEAGVVAVGLPGCNLFLDQEARLPARMLLEAGVRVALATDFNPGTCTCLSLPLMTTLGCARLKLTAAEAMAAVTTEAARALGRAGELGTLVPGARADIACFPAPTHRHLPYAYGSISARWVVVGGEPVYAAPA